MLPLPLQVQLRRRAYLICQAGYRKSLVGFYQACIYKVVLFTSSLAVVYASMAWLEECMWGPTSGRVGDSWRVPRTLQQGV